MWFLALIFALDGTPPSVQLETVYASQRACQSAGEAWLTPQANPTHTVRTFSCYQLSGGSGR